MSLGVTLVETPRRSGAMITARYACEQNREVFAVPGDVRSGKSGGCHSLIRDGAILVEQVQDILDELQSRVQYNPVHGGGSATAALESGPQNSKVRISGDQATVLTQLDTTPCHIEDLGEALGIAAPRILATLTQLELAGWVERLPGMHFSRVPSTP